MSINVQIFNCCPHESNGSIAKILAPLVKGIKNTGAVVDLYYTNRMNIEKCRACTEDPSFQSPGQCNIIDDMNYIYPKMRKSDLWIFASPNNSKSVNTSLVKLLDRLEPLFDPFNSSNNGSKIPIKREDKGNVLLVSTSEDFDFSSFNPVVEHLQAVSLLFSRKYLGSILRPHSWTLNAQDFLSSSINELYSTLEQAGEEIANTGDLKKQTLKAINKNLISKKSFLASLSSEMM